MMEQPVAQAHAIEEEGLSSRDFTRLRELIHVETGICLSPEKKTMVEVRLKRRLRILNMATYNDYCEFVFGRKGMKEELIHLIDVITTNKTDFFREPAHFEFLAQKALPELAVEWPSFSGLERRLFQWRGALHAGHGAERVRRITPRLPLSHLGHGHFNGSSRKGTARHLRVRNYSSRSACPQAQIPPAKP